jgi:hypothetical protein
VGIITRTVSSALTVRNSRVTSPRSDRQSMALMATTTGKRIMKSTPELYRIWSVHAPLVRTCIDIRLGQLMLADWDIVPYDRTEKSPDPGLIRAVRERFEVPNPSGESFGSFISAVGEDLLTLDAGVIEKERTLDGDIYALWPTDGAKVAVARFWDGSPADPRYYWVPAPTIERPLLNSDLIYMMMHPRTYEPVGISYLETLKMSIEAELTGAMFNARQISQAAPDGIMDLGENVRPEQVTAFRSFFEQELAGRGMMGFWGGTKNSKFIPFRGSNREAQFIEFLRYEAAKMAIVFQLSVQDLGLLHDVNRANAEVQQQIGEDRGSRVFLGRVHNYLTSEIVWDKAYGGRRNNLAFRFRTVSDRASLQKAQEMKIALAGMPYESINGGRMAIGLQPIGDPTDQNNPFNKLMANTPLGLATIDLVPNAKELVDRKKPAELGAGDTGKAKADKAYEILATAPDPVPALVAGATSHDNPAEDEEGTGLRAGMVVELISALGRDEVSTRDRETAIRTEMLEALDTRLTTQQDQFNALIKAIAERPIEINMPPITVTVPDGAIKVDAAPVHFERGALQVSLPETKPRRIRKSIVRDPVTHEILSVSEEEIDD